MINSPYNRDRSQQGSVLVLALVFSLVISGLVLSYLKIGQLNSSNVNNATEHQNALYAARSGVSRCNYLITTLDDNIPATTDSSYQFSGESNGHTYYTVITRKSADAPNTSPPFTEDDMEAVYEVVSTGYLGDEKETLVAVLDVEFITAEPLDFDKAIIVEGDLEVGGSAIVTDSAGGYIANVHSNGEKVVLKNGIQIDGEATCSHEHSNPDYTGVQIEGTVTLAGEIVPEDDAYEADHSGVEPIELPSLTAADYKGRADYIMISDGGAHNGEIYVVATDTYVSASTLGWQLTGGGTSWSQKTNPAGPEGTYYAEADISINKNWGSASDPYAMTFLTTGSLSINGTINLQSYLDGLACLVDGNLDVNGNAGSSFAGLYLTHGDLNFSGSAIITGVALGTNGSGTNYVTGNMNFEADTNLDMPITEDEPYLDQAIVSVRKGSMAEQKANLTLFGVE